MRRSLPRNALALLGVLALGCQSYNFNPVNRCLLQPGTQRVTLSDVSSADVLFVVDDSGSMYGEQAKLATAFDAFIDALSQYNDRRVSNQLEPFDFHISVTTTSLFYNGPDGIQDKYVFPYQIKTCTNSGDCTDANYPSCVSGCGGYQAQACCSAQGQAQFVLACIPGIAQDDTPYPAGSFVGYGTNPRVLHYDKSLFGVLVNGTWQAVADPTTAKNKQQFTRQQLKDFFAENVKVGTCGSGQEQGLQAARLGIQKALAGQQRDTRDGSGAIVQTGVTADWPHANAKLVVVYVGDEDDCSAPEDPVRGVVLTGPTGHDSCVADASLPLDQQKEFHVADFVHDLEALGRSAGAAFVVSTSQTTCVDEGCTAGFCGDCQCTMSNGCHSDVCGGQGAGSRFLETASMLRTDGADVVSASICDPGATPCATNADCASLSGSSCVSGCGGALGSYCCVSSGPLAGTLAGTSGFAPILARIAEIVKPPSALLLPTQPAAGEVTRLRITAEDGTTRKVCNGPAEPPLTFAQARDQGYDWWFTASREQLTDADKNPSGATRYIYINHQTNNCEANPGETYVADYLGMVPAGGCVTTTDCSNALGDSTDWTCFAGLNGDGTCVPPTASVPGTCVCGQPTDICPKG